MEEKEYISYMRKMIGHKRMMSVGLACLIYDEKGEILLEKRSDNGKYCLPGGSINFDETVIEGLKREVKEETGISLEEAKLFLILSGKKEEFLYPNGDVTDYVDLIFYSKVDSSCFDEKKEHDSESTSIRFYSPENLPLEEEMLRGTNRPIQKFLSKNFDLEID